MSGPHRNSSVSSDPQNASYADVLEAFINFPRPLAMLGAEGSIERVNQKFRARFDLGQLDKAVLKSLASNPDGAWKHVRLVGDGDAGGEYRVSCVRTAHRVMLIVEETDSAEQTSDLEKLRVRIGDLEQIAATDHLTGAWNRSHLDRVVESEIARSLASRQPLSLILFDIDFFKKINDVHGHAAGDQVLCELVNLARNRVRSSDMLFRWGGEEFVVLVPAAGYRHARNIAEALRQAIAAHEFAAVGTVTVSLGVAEHFRDEDAAAWFRRLDQALYDAKAQGRNRVVVSPFGNSDTWATEGGRSALHLVWQEAFECGEPDIDAEHQELFRLANQLIDASLLEPAEPAAVRLALDELLVHVQGHFAAEEAILSRLHYTELEIHRRAHAGLIHRALQMSAQLDAGKASPGAIVQFLAQDVVARHLMIMDRAFFPLFRKDQP